MFDRSHFWLPLFFHEQLYYMIGKLTFRPEVRLLYDLKYMLSCPLICNRFWDTAQIELRTLENFQVMKLVALYGAGNLISFQT